MKLLISEKLNTGRFFNFCSIVRHFRKKLRKYIVRQLEELWCKTVAMSGRFNGVQAILKKQYKTAVYIHCFKFSYLQCL